VVFDKKIGENTSFKELEVYCGIIYIKAHYKSAVNNTVIEKKQACGGKCHLPHHSRVPCDCTVFFLHVRGEEVVFSLFTPRNIKKYQSNFCCPSKAILKK